MAVKKKELSVSALSSYKKGKTKTWGIKAKVSMSKST